MAQKARHEHARWGKPRGKRPAVIVGIVALAVLVSAGAGVFRSHGSASFVLAAAGPGRATQGGDIPIMQPTAVKAEKGKLPKPTVDTAPSELRLKKAGGKVFDVRALHGAVVKQERPERGAPREAEEAGAPAPGAPLPATIMPSSIAAVNAPAPAPTKSFEGLDFANWGAGHPPDTNGDVGPSHYIETINTSIGIYNKSDGTQVAAFTFNSFMSQGSFGNLCDTNNFGDPVVLYDSFEDRWFISDFAFKVDAAGNVSPQTVFECFAVSKTGDPVTGGWNFYSILAPGGLADYPKFGVWTDGIYMSANLFGYAANASFIAPHVWAINKQQMYAGEPTVQVADFAAPAGDFTLLPANARLQAGTPPVGTPEFFVSTWQFLNAVDVYKLHVDWDKLSTSTLTGPDIPLNATSWPNAAVPNAPTPGNALDTLQIRAMAEAQYSNISGAESIWVAHTVRRANITGFAAPRWYQVNVTGGTVATNTSQGTTWDPDAANTFYRFMPALAVDRLGDMALGYSKSNSTTNPQVKYAGRLAGDPVNTFSQTEQTLIDGTGTQTGNCSGTTCARWGDYSGMSLDPDGCTFWMTNMYYQANGLDHHTRIGSFQFPGCTTVGNGTLSGTVTDGSGPISGATIQLGARATTTNGSGNYSFTVPAGTYASENATKPGYSTASASNLAVPDGGTLTQNFTLSAAAQTGCITDNTQNAFQRGVPSADCDLTSSPGNVTLSNAPRVDQQNTAGTTTGTGFGTPNWTGQTFTEAATGQLTKVDFTVFCNGCTSNPNLAVSIRATSAGLPNGADIASATIAGDNSGASVTLTASFASPPTLTAGTQYALIVHPVSSPGGSGYFWIRSSPSAYAGGQRVLSADSGATWSADSTRDYNFHTYVSAGYASSATFVSSLKDSNPIAGRTAKWTTLSFTSTEPAGTDVKFQVAASNSSFGATNFVGPDGTASTFFSTTGADLSQFKGFRYLRYKAFLTTTSTTATPTLSSVSICFVDVLTTGVSVAPASGTFGGTTNLSATLTAGGNGIGGQSIDFTLNGGDVGSATTDAGGVARLSGVSLAGIDAGTYPTAVGASFAGNDDLDASGVSTGSLTVAKADQVIAVTTHAPATAAYASSFEVDASGGGSNNPVVFSSAGACTSVGAVFTMTSSTGTCVVQYNQAGDNNYNAAAQVTETVTATKATQTITVTNHAPASAVYNTSFTVAATGGASGNPITFSSAGVCTNFGATFTMTSGTGTCIVMYDEAGDANYEAAPQVVETVTAQKASQAITVTTHAPASAVFGTSFGVAATGGGSGNDVTFSSAGGCTNLGATFTMTSGTFTCAVQYDQAGDDNYSAAPQAVETVTAQKAEQTIAVTEHAPSTAAFNESFGVQANAPGGVVSFSSSGVCSNSGNTYTMTSGTGTCTVRYDQAGTDNYNAAPQVTETVTAQKAEQTIAVTTHAPAAAVFNTSFVVAATAPAGAVDVSSSGVCSNTGTTFTMTSGTGTCTVRYDRAGDDNYNAAPQVTETVTAQKATQTIAVTTHAPASAVFGTSFDVAATAAGGAVSFSSTGACSNAGGTFTMTSGTGTCDVGYDQAGNDNYGAATQVVESVTAQKASQTITVTTSAPGSAVFGTTFDVAATAPGGAVSFSSSGACSNAGGTFTMTSGTGTCTVSYDQTGNDNYTAAPAVTQTVTAEKANQAIAVTTHAPASAGFNTSFSVQANAPGGVVGFSSSGVCSNSGNTYTMTSGTGTCTVQYDQTGNDNYNAASQVTETVNAEKASQTIAVAVHAPSSAVYNTSFTVEATGGGSGNAVTFASGGVCTNVGATFTMTSGTGTCTVSYDQAGDDTYNAASQVTETVSAEKANQTIAVTTHAPANAIYNTSFAVAANAPGGAVSFSSAGACSNSGNTFRLTSGSGTCTVGFDQAGDSNYAAAHTTDSVAAQKASQTIAFGALAGKTYGDADFAASATASSGLPIAYSASGACSLAGGNVHITGAGSCTITASQAGDANYGAASVPRTFSIATKDVTILANDRIKLVRRALALGTSAITTNGLVNGDGISGATLSSAGAAAGAKTGTYAIVASAAVAAAGTNLANYAITYAPAKLTVVAVPGVVGLTSVFIGGTGSIIDHTSARGLTGPTANTVARISSNGLIALYGAKIHGNVRSAHGRVSVRTATRVVGNVTAGKSIRNVGVITGTRKANSPSATIKAPSVPACSRFSTDAGISGAFTYSASRGNLRVEPGKTATLAAGAYCFDDLKIPPRSVLKVTGQVTIQLNGLLRAFGTFANTTSSGASLLIASSYSGSNGVALSGGRRAYLTVYAPSTRVKLSGGRAIFGALLGKTLVVSGHSDVHVDIP